MVRNLPANTGDIGNRGLIPGSGRSPGEVKPTPISAWRIPWTESLRDYRPQGCKELDMTEHTHNEEYT